MTKTVYTLYPRADNLDSSKDEKYEAIKAHDINTDTVLDELLDQCDDNIAEKISKHIALPTAQLNNYYTYPSGLLIYPIHSALMNENSEAIVPLLLTKTIALNVCDDQGNTPLHYTVRDARGEDTFSLSLFKMLLEKNVAVNVGNNQGHTPLHFAAQLCTHTQECISLLLQKGADRRAIDKEGNLPLFYAASNEDRMNRETLALLMVNTDDLLHMNTMKRNALDNLAQFNSKLLKELKEYIKRSTQAVFSLCISILRPLTQPIGFPYTILPQDIAKKIALHCDSSELIPEALLRDISEITITQQWRKKFQEEKEKHPEKTMLEICIERSSPSCAALLKR